MATIPAQTAILPVAISTGANRRANYDLPVSIAGGVLAAPEETILVAGALSLTGDSRLDATSGAYAVTLAAPSVAGVVKTITMTVAGNAITLSLANCIGGTAATTASFDAVNEQLTLISGPNKWMVVGQAGVTLS